MVRLVFRPYTQVRRSICTLEPLRTSTRVSPGFVLLRHSSPSFGSQHMCSNSNLFPEGAWSVGSAVTLLPQHIRAFTFISRSGVYPKHLHTCQTPWSVFQDGLIQSILGRSFIRTTVGTTTNDNSSFPRKQRSLPTLVYKYTRNTLLCICFFSAISGTLSLFFQSSFHLSLTVLVCYRSLFHIQLQMEFTTHQSCIPKQLDSSKTQNSQEHLVQTGLSPSSAGLSRPFYQTSLPSVTFSRPQLRRFSV